MKDGKFNLAFGDAKKGKIDDKIVSNNNDILKLISTVAAIIYDFYSHYPDAIVVIAPIDKRRSALYHGIFKRRFAEIVEYFQVLGIMGSHKESFSIEGIYEKFEIKRKK